MKLIEYLTDIGITPAVFAKKANISAPTIYNVLKGKDIYLSIALRIEKATKRKVKCRELISESRIKKKRNRILPYKPRILQQTENDDQQTSSET